MFCRHHEAAPAAQRGGWLSAERRRRQLVTKAAPTMTVIDTEPHLDASNITRRLWIGGQPPFERDIPGFDTLVLCAREIQPERLAFHGEVIRCPIDDHPPTTYEVRQALAASRNVAASLSKGRRVLVTCYAGLNRSALVSALALGVLYPRSTPAELVLRIRQRRSPNALSNPHFVHVIERYRR